MNRELKSMSYAFIANNIDVYVQDSEKQNHFIATALVCSNCCAFWHTPLLECYFCGEINYYFYTCSACGKRYSITNSSVKCTCKLPNSQLVKICANEDCISNADVDVKALTMHEGGVFELKSTFNISQMCCVKCGHRSNTYKFFRVFIVTDNNLGLNNFIIENGVEKSDLLIFKSRINQQFLYDYLIVTDVHTLKQFSPNFTHKLSDIIEKVFS